MKKSRVRCWQVEVWRGGSEPDVLYISYPEDNSGYDLISCLNCGHVYSVSIASLVYKGPLLSERLRDLPCVECGEALINTYSSYPDHYLNDGSIQTYLRSSFIPSDEDSLVVEFDEIYS